MSKRNLKVIIICVLCVVEVATIFLMWKSFSGGAHLTNKVIDSVDLSLYKNELLAIMIGDDKGVYTEYENDGWPSSLKYHYNQTRSGCIDGKGNTLSNALRYENNNVLGDSLWYHKPLKLQIQPAWM